MHKVMLSGNNTYKTSFVNIQDFSIIKALNVVIKPPKALSITEVLWAPLSTGWIKYNTNVAFAYESTITNGGGIFRNHLDNFIPTFC